MESFWYLMYFYGFENQHLQTVLPETSHRKRWLKCLVPSQQTHPCLERNTYGTYRYYILSFINIQVWPNNLLLGVNPPPAFWSTIECFVFTKAFWGKLCVLMGYFYFYRWKLIPETTCRKVTGKFLLLSEGLLQRQRPQQSLLEAKIMTELFVTLLESGPKQSQGKVLLLEDLIFFLV